MNFSISELVYLNPCEKKNLNIAPRATVSDKNVKCKQGEKNVNKGENHTKVISSPPKCQGMMEISVSK